MLRAALALLSLSAAVACSGRPLDEGRDAGGPAAAGGSERGGATAGSTGSAGAAGSAATAGSTGSAGAAGIAGSEGAVTEWTIPFADSQPFQIAAWGWMAYRAASSIPAMVTSL